MLGLDNTPVSDLTPLASLTALTNLWLNNTPVSDLRPIAGLSGLVNDPAGLGLTFVECGATQNDARIAEIAEIEDNAERARTLFAYLKDWEPGDSALPADGPMIGDQSDPGDLPEQTMRGFTYAVSSDGKVGYAKTGDGQSATDLLVELHTLLSQDIAALIKGCGSGHNQQFAQFLASLEYYQAALGAALSDMVGPTLWNQGNKLRRELISTDNRDEYDLDAPPPLSAPLRDGLEALVALHNTFVSNHPVLSVLDQDRIDPVDRARADADRVLVQETVTAMQEQTGVVRQEVLDDFALLSEEAGEETDRGHRALGVEKNSLTNLINAAVTRAIVSERKETVGRTIAGDIRATLVGTATAASLPFIATTFPQFIVVMEPFFTSVLAAWHGADYPILKAVKWLVARARARAETE